MTKPREVKSARRLLGALVIGVFVLNVVLFLLFSRSPDPSPGPAPQGTNGPRAR